MPVSAEIKKFFREHISDAVYWAFSPVRAQMLGFQCRVERLEQENQQLARRLEILERRLSIHVVRKERSPDTTD